MFNVWDWGFGVECLRSKRKAGSEQCRVYCSINLLEATSSIDRNAEFAAALPPKKLSGVGSGNTGILQIIR